VWACVTKIKKIIYLLIIFTGIENGGAVVGRWASDQKVIGSSPDCAQYFTSGGKTPENSGVR